MKRRTFLGTIASAAAAVQTPQGRTPWYLRAYRWGQTNITEQDPARYDIAWWREYWKRTRIQGVIINAGGIFAYYPSKFPLHFRPPLLGDRDLFGEVAAAARGEGLAVLARMDSNRASEAFYRAHPDWFARDAAGTPYRAGDRYVSCVNSPYYEEYIPAVLEEIAGRSHPDGFTDNSWSGLGRDSICHCENCARKFRDSRGSALPRKADWNDPAYRKWIEWSYDRRIEIWDLNNKTTRAAGGPDCIWAGMNSGSIASQCRSFRDYKRIGERAAILMLDHQTRSDPGSFEQNADAGKLIHGVLGWDKLIPESTALYQAGRTPFRLASKPLNEARLWALEGFAGGIQPWWHHVGAYHEDRRMYRTAEPLFRWHEANQEYLVNRRPIASIGVVWSQRNTDFYGRDDASDLVELPYRGFTHALVRARIPYIPVHADHIDRDAPDLAVLVLPNLAAVTDGQCAAIRRFVERGGSLIATGASTLYDEWGDQRPDFALADLFGAHPTAAPVRPRAGQSLHTYLRLAPELRARVWGPKAGDEPQPSGARHPVLQGFDETDILPFGGALDPLKVDARAQVLATFIPPFPVYPPETAWMREPKTDIPALIVNTRENGARIAYLPADIDRRFARDNLPDHANLLANVVRWAAGASIPLEVEGRGLLDSNLYRQQSRLILHIVNLTNPGAWRAPVDELIPIGPLRVRVKLPDGVKGAPARFLVAGGSTSPTVRQGWAGFEVKSVLDHEVVVIG